MPAVWARMRAGNCACWRAMTGAADGRPYLFRRVLVTRPARDAAPLIRAIRRRGGAPVPAPMMRISPVADGAARLAPCLPLLRGLLFTSANGVRAFCGQTARRDVPVYAVGAVTAALARRAGFADVAVAGGDVASLAALVRERRAPGQGPLIHIAGSHVAGDLGGLLRAAEFEVHRIVLYHAEEASRLSPRALAALRSPGGVTVLLYSPRTARIFTRLAREAGAEAALARAAALCLSPAVAEAAGNMRWRRVAAAAAPDRKALLEALEQLWRIPRTRLPRTLSPPGMPCR